MVESGWRHGTEFDGKGARGVRSRRSILKSRIVKNSRSSLGGGGPSKELTRLGRVESSVSPRNGV